MGYRSRKPQRVVRLTESDLTRIVRRVLNEEADSCSNPKFNGSTVLDKIKCCLYNEAKIDESLLTTITSPSAALALATQFISKASKVAGCVAKHSNVKALNEEYKGDFTVVKTAAFPEDTQEQLGRVYVTKRDKDGRHFIYADAPRGNGMLTIDNGKASISFGGAFSKDYSGLIPLKLSQKNLQFLTKLFNQYK